MTKPTIERGPVRILCDEIGFRFDERLEQPAVLIAFVRELVREIAFEREIGVRSKGFVVGPGPSEASGEVLALAEKMLSEGTRESAAAVHDAAHVWNPEDGPCDHLIDMLSSCASALRFGLETPCHSRHAAAAASHVWGRLYGVSRFDGYT